MFSKQLCNECWGNGQLPELEKKGLETILTPHSTVYSVFNSWSFEMYILAKVVCLLYQACCVPMLQKSAGGEDGDQYLHA